MKQGLAEQGMHREQEKNHLERPDHALPTPRPASLLCESHTIFIPTKSSQAQQFCFVCSAYLASLKLLPHPPSDRAMLTHPFKNNFKYY